MARLEKADIVGLFGGTGSGKSYRCRQLIKGKKRVLIWDTMEEYEEKTVVSGDMKQLIAILKQKKQFRIAFRPSFRDLPAQFSQFCRLSYAVGNMHVVCEELNRVTRPSFAPPDWQSMTSRGRHRGLHIIGLSQRPAGVDKDFIGNATEIYAGRLTYKRDCQALESVFNEDAKLLPALKNHKQIHWKG